MVGSDLDLDWETGKFFDRASALPHDWIPSTLGHGETMCRRCKITNREAAALGVEDRCSANPPPRSFDIWTIYYNTSDHPGMYVARRFDVDVPTSDMFVADTLDEVRALLPPGLYCLPRNVKDDPVIVEVWV
jgi:hypothetical protein